MNANFIKSTALIAAIVLSGCATQQEPLCDREAIEWDKYGTAEVPKECRPNLDVVELCCEPTQTQAPMPEPPKQEPPTSEPPKEEPPTERVKGNNGLGNGDQRAPGNSLDRNKAENERGNPGHKSGKAQKSG